MTGRGAMRCSARARGHEPHGKPEDAKRRGRGVGVGVVPFRCNSSIRRGVAGPGQGQILEGRLRRGLQLRESVGCSIVV